MWARLDEAVPVAQSNTEVLVGNQRCLREKHSSKEHSRTPLGFPREKSCPHDAFAETGLCVSRDGGGHLILSHLFFFSILA